jgi:RimJ/RimL family protein N-acetyltransferase
MTFVPDTIPVPDKLQTDDFILRPLRVTDVELDYDAVMETREFLRAWSQSEWPWDKFTIADNEKDLERHEQEHRDREAFTFTVMNVHETRCLGCVYIRPLPDPLRDSADWLTEQELPLPALVSFWVRQSCMGRGLDGILLDALRDWFRSEWPFSSVLFFTDPNNARQKSLMVDSGMHFRREMQLWRSPVKWVVYG